MIPHGLQVDSTRNPENRGHLPRSHPRHWRVWSRRKRGGCEVQPYPLLRFRSQPQPLRVESRWTQCELRLWRSERKMIAVPSQRIRASLRAGSCLLRPELPRWEQGQGWSQRLSWPVEPRSSLRALGVPRGVRHLIAVIVWCFPCRYYTIRLGVLQGFSCGNVIGTRTTKHHPRGDDGVGEMGEGHEEPTVVAPIHEFDVFHGPIIPRAGKGIKH